MISTSFFFIIWSQKRHVGHLRGSLDRLTWTTLQSQTTDFVAPIYRRMFVERQPLHHQVQGKEFQVDVFLVEFYGILFRETDIFFGVFWCFFKYTLED